MTKISFWAKAIGGSLARVQHSLDQVAEWGFQKMKEAGKETKKAQATTSRPVRAAKGALKFLGETGDAFYTEYDELKRKEK